MGARIVELSHVVARRQEDAVAPELRPSELPAALRFRFWRGASGVRYLHTVYGLVDCPPLPRANYILVRRTTTGTSEILRIAHTSHAAGSLNLAEVRHRGAKLGANEIHVHFLAETEHDRRIVELDLSSRMFGTLTAERNTTGVN